MKSRSDRLQRFLDALPNDAAIDDDAAINNAAAIDVATIAFVFDERQQDEAAAVAGGPGAQLVVVDASQQQRGKGRVLLDDFLDAKMTAGVGDRVDGGVVIGVDFSRGVFDDDVDERRRDQVEDGVESLSRLGHFRLFPVGGFDDRVDGDGA